MNLFLDCGHRFGTPEFAQLENSPEWQIHAWDPNPALPPCCPCVWNITHHKEAVWVEDCKREFKLVDCPEGELVAGSCSLADIETGRPVAETVGVECIDFARWLDAYAHGHEMVACKMDIEGAEFAVLRHLLDTGAINLISVLIVETHERWMPKENPNTVGNLMRAIKAQGVEVKPWK